MIRRPFETEWNVSQLCETRREYLQSGLSFEQIAAQISSEMQVIAAKIEPYESPAPGEPKKNTRQVVFLISVSPKACDLFYNAPDGMRARYWHSPDHGFGATKHLISKAAPALLAFASQNPPTRNPKAAEMSIADIQASLETPSAKIWIRERDDQKNFLLTKVDKLSVPRWEQNERHATQNPCMWRRSQSGGELEIKGGLIDLGGVEYVPDGKRNRSCQIHCFGFT